MPVYKGTTEIASGKLYKATTSIENGYKGTNSFYVNQVTVSFATPTGQSLTYTAPSPASSTGVPGAAFPSTTFTITGGSTKALSGTAVVAGLPSGLTYSQSYNNSNGGNVLTITIAGNYPTTSSLNTALTISGLTITTLITRPMTITRTVTPSGTSGNSSRQASYNVTYSGSGSATFYGNTGFGSAGGATCGISFSSGNNGAPSAITINGNTNGIWANWQNATAVEVQAQGNVTLHTAADGTYLQTSITLGATGASSISS